VNRISQLPKRSLRQTSPYWLSSPFHTREGVSAVPSVVSRISEPIFSGWSHVPIPAIAGRAGKEHKRADANATDRSLEFIPMPFP